MAEFLQDMTELLEKRVKSRFSHRFIHLLPAENLHTFMEMIESGLCISDADGIEDEAYATEFNYRVKVCSVRTAFSNVGF